MEYPWPGNSLQIESFMERLVLTAGKRSLDEKNVRELMDELYSFSMEENLETEIGSTSGGLPFLGKEAAEIKEALEQCGGNREKTAAKLGISKPTLWRKMKKYGINVEK